MGLCALPDLLNDDRYPNDVKERVRHILADCGGHSVGAYTDSAGLKVVKQNIAKYIQNRDGGIPASPDDIFLTTGASDGIKVIMELLLTDHSQKAAGFMIPIPQYPLYSATISEYSAQQIGYYLDEENNWALNIDELQRAYNESLNRCEPRAICVINPGNPTGSVLSRENIEQIIKFAHKNRLFILADEVYQHNVYGEGLKFHSFKKVANELGAPYKDIELVSFFSVSKGYMGE
jgi:alanine transaminase